MIIDTSCYPTDQVDLAWWHDGEPFTGERLLAMMDGPYFVNGKPRRIDKAFIQPPQGNTIYTWTDGELSGRESIDAYMAYTLKMVQAHPDRTGQGFEGALCEHGAYFSFCGMAWVVAGLFKSRGDSNALACAGSPLDVASRLKSRGTGTDHHA